MNILSQYDEAKVINNLEDESLDVENEDLDQNITDIPVNSKERRLYIDKVDKSTSDLFRMIREEEIILKPSYQRNFVWSNSIMSKFIESLLLAIPIPTIFLAENDDSTYEVIDGQQRLTTIFSFMKSDLSSTNIDDLNEEYKKIDILTLSNLDTLSSFNGKKYVDLDKEIRRKFNNVSLPIVIIQKDSSEDIKFDIFSRINQGSVKLNAQELRNVMYRGILMDKVNELADTEIVNETFGNKPILKKRFGFQEIILRAILMNELIDKDEWVMKEKGSLVYGGRLNTSIIKYLRVNKNSKEETKKIEKFILNAFENVRIVFGENAFMRWNNIENKHNTSINKSVAELQLVVLGSLTKEQVVENYMKIRKSFIDFSKEMDNDLFTKGTNNTRNVAIRYEWGKFLKEELLHEKG